jgi:excisionase family DNA binding protein
MNARNRKSFCTKKELAEYLGISVYTIDSWVSERREIPFVKMGKKVMFDLRDVDDWIEKKKVRPITVGAD